MPLCLQSRRCCKTTLRCVVRLNWQPVRRPSAQEASRICPSTFFRWHAAAVATCCVDAALGGRAKRCAVTHVAAACAAESPAAAAICAGRAAGGAAAGTTRSAGTWLRGGTPSSASAYSSHQRTCCEPGSVLANNRIRCHRTLISSCKTRCTSLVLLHHVVKHHQ